MDSVYNEMMESFNRKINRFIIYSGAQIGLITAGIFFLLNISGVLEKWFPTIPSNLITLAVFVVFAILHIYQRSNFESGRPRLLIQRSGWGIVTSGQVERLFVSIWNRPYINSLSSSSKATSARVLFYSKLSKKEPEFDFENVRWQGTAEPKAKGFEYQPFDKWVVEIESGRSRKLYFALRKAKPSKNYKPVYVHNDLSYKEKKYWMPKNLLLKERDYYVCIILQSSSFDPKEYWFDFDGNTLKRIKFKPFGIKVIENS